MQHARVQGHRSFCSSVKKKHRRLRHVPVPEKQMCEFVGIRSKVQWSPASWICQGHIISVKETSRQWTEPAWHEAVWPHLASSLAWGATKRLEVTSHPDVRQVATGVQVHLLNFQLYLAKLFSVLHSYFLWILEEEILFCELHRNL